MALTLKTAITANDTTIDVNGTDTIREGSYRQIGDEVLLIRTARPQNVITGINPWQRLSVDRGIENTEPASHDAGTTMAAYSAPGGGVTNSAPANAIAVSDGTNLTGSSSLTWTGGNRLGLVAAENGTAQIVGIGVGTQIQLGAADGDATHVGGELTLTSGNSVGQSGGQLGVIAGHDDADGDGGPVVIYSGYAAGGQSGDIDIKVGPNGSSTVGGHINIIAGTGATGSGGSVLIQAGPKVTGGSHGTVQIYSANGAHSLELSETAGFQFFGGVVVFDGLPSADPEVAGQLYTDGVVSAGTPQALMVSGGPA